MEEEQKKMRTVMIALALTMSAASAVAAKKPVEAKPKLVGSVDVKLGNSVIVSLRPDGTVEFGSGYSPNIAAQLFWMEVSRSNPMSSLYWSMAGAQVELAVRLDEQRRSYEKAIEALDAEKANRQVLQKENAMLKSLLTTLQPPSAPKPKT